MFTLCGPAPLHTFYLPLSGHTPGPEHSETRWHMTALYISPAHRGRGLAKKLIDTSMKFAQEYSATLGPEVRARLRLVVDPDNVAVKGVYGARVRRCGEVHAFGGVCCEWGGGVSSRGEREGSGKVE